MMIASSPCYTSLAAETSGKSFPVLISLTRPGFIPNRAAISCCIIFRRNNSLIEAAISGVTFGERRGVGIFFSLCLRSALP